MVENDVLQFLVHVATFVSATLATYMLGKQLVRIKIPLITAYLCGGILAGPFILDIVHKESLKSLKFVNQFALATIAFSAGAELYYPDLKSKLRSIMHQMTGITVVTIALTIAIVALLSSKVEFIETYSMQCRVSIAAVCGSVMVARSPSSALALVNELRAKGPVTKMLIGVTVVSDVALLVSFAITSAIAEAECLGGGLDGYSFLILLGTLVGCLGIGWLLGKLLVFYLWIPSFYIGDYFVHVPSQLRGVLILPTGYAFFPFSDWLADYSEERWGRTINLEPLLVCMIASCIAGNESHNRRKLNNILHKSAPFVYVPFFTLTGAALDFSAIGLSLYFAALVFAVRLLAIACGSWGAGAIFGGLTKHQYKFMWMTLTTQAGAALGVANEISHNFAGWGQPFAAAVISVVILNQLIGPFMFKIALERLGEAYRIPKSIRHVRGHVTILGVDPLTEATGRRLVDMNCPTWMVRCEPDLPAGLVGEYEEVPEGTYKALHQGEGLRRLVLKTEKPNPHIEEDDRARLTVLNSCLPDIKSHDLDTSDMDRLPGLDLRRYKPFIVQEDNQQPRSQSRPSSPFSTADSTLSSSERIRLLEAATGGDHYGSTTSLDEDTTGTEDAAVDLTNMRKLTVQDVFLLRYLETVAPSDKTNAVVVSLSTDSHTLRWCRLLSLRTRKPRLIAVMKSPARLKAFRKLGVLVVYPVVATAEVTAQLVCTHSSMPLEVLPSGGINVSDVADLLYPEESLLGASMTFDRLKPPRLSQDNASAFAFPTPTKQSHRWLRTNPFSSAESLYRALIHRNRQADTLSSLHMMGMAEPNRMRPPTPRDTSASLVADPSLFEPDSPGSRSYTSSFWSGPMSQRTIAITGSAPARPRSFSGHGSPGTRPRSPSHSLRATMHDRFGIDTVPMFRDFTSLDSVSVVATPPVTARRIHSPAPSRPVPMRPGRGRAYAPGYQTSPSALDIRRTRRTPPSPLARPRPHRPSPVHSSRTLPSASLETEPLILERTHSTDAEQKRTES